MSEVDGKHHYSATDAELYDSLGIAGTTYEIGYDAVARQLGELDGQTYLDFGCGTGRSTRLLLALGASHVYGVDHDANMVGQAAATRTSAEFLHIGDTIPLPDASVDGAISLSVFIEIRTLEAMRQVCAEVARVLRPGGLFVIVSANPNAFGCSFRNFSHSVPREPVSGALATCTVHTPNGDVIIEDTYWREDDYTEALSAAGLLVRDIEYPMAEDPSQWDTDEATVSPAIVITAEKPH